MSYRLNNLKSITVHAGTNQLNTNGQSYGVEKAVAHKGFSSVTLVNDIALIRVNKNIAFNNLVKPIKLATGSNNYEGSNCVLSGWGTTKVSSKHSRFDDYLKL